MNEQKRAKMINMIIAILVTILIVGLVALTTLSGIEDFKEDLQECQNKGYEGIYWGNKINFDWSCYKYKDNGEMIISQQPLGVKR